ncbi:MAG: 2-C-methyl-D-erythritol 2,4-cyclodiphosphate synthase [Acidimicrobiales bacterium]
MTLPVTPSGLRVGHGFDVHRFSTSDRPLVLGGVPVSATGGLDGHSDADVVCHALSDALLGALALGDMGRHFPDTDERFRGANSLELLAQVRTLVGNHGASVANADCTVVCEQPRLAPYVEEMQRRVGKVLGAPVSVKATRAEGLGALGRVEGIAAMAVVLVVIEGTP